VMPSKRGGGSGAAERMLPHTLPYAQAQAEEAAAAVVVAHRSAHQLQFKSWTVCLSIREPCLVGTEY
jgi:hypothetical protein